MDKLKLFVYPIARPHVHDDETIHHINGVSQYINTVPMSKKGIGDYFEIVNPYEADYFYMGQISDGARIPEEDEFTFFKGNEERHICDIEGDWINKTLPPYLKKCILTINGARKEYRGVKMFVRPTFSFLLADLARNKQKHNFSFKDNLCFGFKGFPDPYGVRFKMRNALFKSQLRSQIIFNQKWMAQNLPNSKETQEYLKIIENNTFSLCPMGAGFDSIRFFESCYFGKIPVIISDIFVPFEEEFKKPFFFQIFVGKTEEEMAENFKQISKTNIDTLREMSLNAQEYFETYIREYFKDPTKMFLNWLNKI